MIHQKKPSTSKISENIDARMSIIAASPKTTRQFLEVKTYEAITYKAYHIEFFWVRKHKNSSISKMRLHFLTSYRTIKFYVSPASFNGCCNQEDFEVYAGESLDSINGQTTR